MGTKQKKQNQAGPKKVKGIKSTDNSISIWWYVAGVLAFTFVVFLPILKNGFTNWDDTLYITQNPLLKHLNGEGLKAIFSTPVVSNYHPLTILSLAMNYQVGELSPTGYWITNILLHVLNTGLVFWFVFLLSAGNRWVSAFVALLFGIHPMHVESVAWASERKDLLYTLFYMSALIVYVKYVKTFRFKFIALTTLFGILSLLSKPAAIVLPLSLLLVDYLLRRPWNIKWILEKIPLFLCSAIMAYVTVAIQSKRAIASTDQFDILSRLSFGGFGWTWYLLKIIVPIPLSALHPFPEQLTIWYYIALIGVIGFVVFALLKIRNRNFLFGFGFYTVNLILVLQVVSIGNAVVAERYTYVPYIGIFFWMAIEGYKLLKGKLAPYKNVILGVLTVWILLLTWLSVKRESVWNSSQALWQDVLNHYPDSKRAWTNKGLDFYDQKKYPEVVDHLNRALETDPNYLDALEWRARTYLEMQQPDKALADALKFQQLRPTSETAIFLLARAYDGTRQSEQAMNLYSQLVNEYPKPEYYNNRGVIYFNQLKQYEAAKREFETAIQLSPQNGSYMMNLSRCYYMLGDNQGARKYAAQAKQLGETVDEAYGKAILLL